MNACLWLKDGPAEPFEVTFKAGSDQDHCMYQRGQDATFNVSHSGITCAPVGYVEGKSSSSGGDTCWSDYSNWGLSYTGGNYSGFAFAHWTTSGFGSNSGYELQDNSQGTKVCMGQGLCSRTTQYWSTSDTPQLYVSHIPTNPCLGTTCKVPQALTYVSYP